MICGRLLIFWTMSVNSSTHSLYMNVLLLAALIYSSVVITRWRWWTLSSLIDLTWQASCWPSFPLLWSSKIDCLGSHPITNLKKASATYSVVISPPWAFTNLLTAVCAQGLGSFHVHKDLIVYRCTRSRNILCTCSLSQHRAEHQKPEARWQKTDLTTWWSGLMPARA